MKDLIAEEIDMVSNSLSDFFSKMTNTGIIIFDFETNGVYTSNSVLSVSATLYNLDCDKKMIFPLESYNRYYYCKEQESPQAILVNNLTRDNITKLREKTFHKCGTYPEYFDEDEGFKNFCKGITSYIGHNLKFDLGFVTWIENPNVFDTMFSNTNIVKSSWNAYRKEWKWPKLSETASFYGIRLLDESLHDSNYDIELTASIFEKMMTLGEYRLKKNLESIIPF